MKKLCVDTQSINKQVGLQEEKHINEFERLKPKKVVQPYGPGEGCYCPSCGAGVNKDFCGKCGQRLEWN